MNRRAVTLLGLCFALLAAAGCIVEAPPPRFEVVWSLQYVGEDRYIGCDVAGADTVRLLMRNRDTAEDFEEVFPCEDGIGHTRVLPVGLYDLRIQLETTGVDGAPLPVSELVNTWELVRGAITHLGYVTFGVQSFVATWTVNQAGRSVTCQDVGGATVELVTRYGSEPELVYEYACRAHQGATTAIPIGAYAWRLRLLDANGAVLDETATQNVEVDDVLRARLPLQVFEVP